MNQYYNYENKKYWNKYVWAKGRSRIYGLVKWIGENVPLDKETYPYPVDSLYGTAVNDLECYQRKTNAVNIPEIVQGWNKRNVHYECRSQGGFSWIIMCPQKCMSDYKRKLPVLLVFHMIDLSDPYWAMKTLETYHSYNEMVAKQQDRMIYYICLDKPDYDNIYVNILQEAFVFTPGDVNDIYLDVNDILRSGMKLSDIPDFDYTDSNGNAINPDECICEFGEARVPALDISGRWENKTSLTRDQVAAESWGNQFYDPDFVINSESGRKMAEGMAVEYEFDNTFDPAFLQYWDDRGVKYENRELNGRRWKASIPKSALEKPNDKLPVVCIMQEVNQANEHLAVREVSYFYEYYRLCGEGECILISFVLEDPDSNDLLADIIDEARILYPMIDSRRIYIIGHSHNGHYALEFAYRHPDLIAAVATFGDPPGLADSGITPMTEKRAKETAEFDMPVINLCGMCEHLCHYPISMAGRGYRDNDASKLNMDTLQERVRGWQLRLQASNCPSKSEKEITDTRYSDDKAIRELGIPGDRSQTVWMDGFELYIVEVKNYDGRYHLCMVGEENMPHNTTPNQQVVSWNFLRRFERDPETKKIIELY